MDALTTAWRSCTELALVERQLAAIQAWHTTRHCEVTGSSAAGREARLDRVRRQAARSVEHQAIVGRADTHLRQGMPLMDATRVRAVVAHRNEWFCAKLRTELEANGVQVIATLDDGAHAIAAIVKEQPDLLFVEDLLPTVTGIELINRARVYAPDALVAAQARDDTAIAPLLQAGAHAVYHRRISPAEVAKALVSQFQPSPTGRAHRHDSYRPSRGVPR